jgi:hypothetical protein
MTPVLTVWAIAPALVVVHVVRCVLADRRDRRRAARPVVLRLVPPSNVVDLAQYAARRDRGSAA